VARVCLEALAAPASIGRIVEITSAADAETPATPTLAAWLATLS